jgi:DNA invertase Pin-like site-specific DNA recombinase
MKRQTARRIARLARKHTVTEIATMVGETQQAVRRLLKALGVTAQRAYASPLADEAAVARVLFANDWNYEKTAAHFGVSKQAIYRRFPGGRKKHARKP